MVFCSWGTAAAGTFSGHGCDSAYAAVVAAQGQAAGQHWCIVVAGCSWEPDRVATAPAAGSGSSVGTGAAVLRWWVAVSVAVGETVILLHPPLPFAVFSIAMERERQQNDSLADG